MSDIANHLGISKRTLYQVFKDKEELLEACLNKEIVRADMEMEDLLRRSDNVIDTMLLIYSKHLKDVHNMNKSVIYDLRKYHPRLYKIIEEKQKGDVDTFIPLFEKGVEQGLMRADLNFEILIWVLKSQFKMLMEENFMPTDRFPLEDFMEAIILTFTRGIATPKGNIKIEEFIAKLNIKEENK